MAPRKRTTHKKEKPLVVFLRLYGDAQKRMRLLCEKFSTNPNAVGMAGTLSEMHRLERLPAEVTHEEVVTLAEARAHHVDTVATLRAAIAEKISKPETK